MRRYRRLAVVENDDITRRLAELGEPAVKKTQVSVESLLNELETTIHDARAAKQHSVVVNALTLSAKLVGLLREQVEIVTGFEGVSTVEEIIEKCEAELGHEAAETLQMVLDNDERASISDPHMRLAYLDREREALMAEIAEGATVVDVLPKALPALAGPASYDMSPRAYFEQMASADAVADRRRRRAEKLANVGSRVGNAEDGQA